MVAKAKKILISTETREHITLTFGKEQQNGSFCEVCGGETKLISSEAAAAVAGNCAAAGPMTFDIGRVHLIETTTGGVLICKRSLWNELERVSNSSSQNTKEEQ